MTRTYPAWSTIPWPIRRNNEASLVAVTQPLPHITPCKARMPSGWSQFAPGLTAAVPDLVGVLILGM